jgi:Ca-activated chloride channel family protein
MIPTPLIATIPVTATSVSIGTVEWLAPLLLLLLPLALLPWWRVFDGRMRGTIRYSSTDLLAACTGGLWPRFRFVPTLLRTLAIVSLVVCLARPGKADEETRVFVEGVAIQMLVDRSSSMQALDFSIAGRPVDRLSAVKSVAKDFIVGGDGLPGRPDDLIGLITFAGFADSLCPLTLDHDHVLGALASIRMAERPDEDGTAIGDAIALSVERLRDLEDRKEIKSRIMILLTDGENTAGDLEPAVAAEIAKAYGIKIYTIGVGTRGFAKVPVQFMGRTVLRDVPVSIDEDTLREVARTTGGEYFRATDTDSLVEIYEKIDSLEKTRTEQRRYRQFEDFATDSFRFAGIAMPPLLVVPLVLLALDLLLSGTRLRRLP